MDRVKWELTERHRRCLVEFPAFARPPQIIGDLPPPARNRSRDRPALVIPPDKRRATRHELSAAELFLKRAIEPDPDPDARLLAADLYRAYTAWCGEKGLKAASTNRFGRFASRSGLCREKSGRISYLGVRLRAPSAPEKGPNSSIGPHRSTKNRKVDQ